MPVHVLAENQHELDRLRDVIRSRLPAAREGVLQRRAVIAAPVVAHRVALDHHFGGALEDDAGPDVRAVIMHRDRNLLDRGAEGLELGDRRADFLVGRGIAGRVREAFLHDGDLHALHALAERAHVVLHLGDRGPRVVAVGPGDRGQKARDVFGRAADRAAVIDRIGDRHASGHRNETPGGLETVDAAPAGRRADRAALIAAERHVDVLRGDQRGAAAR